MTFTCVYCGPLVDFPSIRELGNHIGQIHPKIARQMIVELGEFFEALGYIFRKVKDVKNASY